MTETTTITPNDIEDNMPYYQTEVISNNWTSRSRVHAEHPGRRFWGRGAPLAIKNTDPMRSIPFNKMHPMSWDQRDDHSIYCRDWILQSIRSAVRRQK